MKAVAFLAFLLAWSAAWARELQLRVDLDPATGRFSAVAELDRPAGSEYKFFLHSTLKPRRAVAGPVFDAQQEWRVRVPASGRVRIEYGGVLMRLNPDIDHRGVLRELPPMASPAGSYLPSGSGWYPEPGGRFTYRISVQVRSGIAVVPGRLVNESRKDTGYRADFLMGSPVEGIDLMAGPYEVQERQANGLRFRTYFFRELAELAPGYLEDSIRYVERYSRSIGPYPYAGFSVVASPLPTGFGMPGLTYLGASVLKLPFIRATSLGHEVLHNWWGNGVAPDYERGNWAEGLTTFMADYAYREEASPAAARDMRLGWLRDLAAAPAQEPLAGFRARSHGAAAVTGYAKSAMVFLMLRDRIGAEAFERALRGFWASHRHGVASWEDLRAAFELASGEPLGGLFEQWLLRRDAPAVAITQARVESGMLELSFRQRHPHALRVPVELQWADRSEMRVVTVSRAEQVVQVPVASKPEAVRLDPELRVWRLLEAAELPPIFRQWILSPSPRVRGVSGRAAEAVVSLADALFESKWQPGEEGAPLLIAGLHADVDAELARRGLPPRPAEVAGRGTAQAWTIPGTSIAIVSGADPAAIAATARSLPHLGAQSYAAFEGGRSIVRGAWPAAVPRIAVR